MNRESERKRLVELIKDSLNKHIGKSCLLAENIASDLLDNGIVVPLVKVGQTVYIIFEKKIYEANIDRMSIVMHKSGNGIIRIRAEFEIEDWFYNDGRKTTYGVYRDYPDFYFTREEAEKALEGKEDEKND